MGISLYLEVTINCELNDIVPCTIVKIFHPGWLKGHIPLQLNRWHPFY